MHMVRSAPTLLSSDATRKELRRAALPSWPCALDAFYAIILILGRVVSQSWIKNLRASSAAAELSHGQVCGSVIKQLHMRQQALA